MKNKLLPLWDKLLLRKRALIESVGEQRKYVRQSAHTRPRNVYHAFVHASAALVAYTWQDHKPSLHLTPEEQILLAEAFWPYAELTLEYDTLQLAGFCSSLDDDKFLAPLTQNMKQPQHVTVF